MASFYEGVKKIFTSYWSIFRLVFVVFFLFLLGDAFYRWDAFRHYATFKSFVPSAGLISIFWVVLAALVSLVFYLVSIVISPILRVLDRTDRTGHLLDIVQERITPLVWGFGLWVLLSLPIVVYQTWVRDSANITLKQDVQVTVSDEERPNIIFVSFDALRRRSMSVYGYHRPTTPFISEWAKSASVFTRLESESLNTFQTTPSMMNGKRVWTNQIYHEHGRNRFQSNEENMPAVLKKNGYYTIMISANRIANAKKMGINDSIDIEIPFNKVIETPVWIGTETGRINAALYSLFNSKILMYQWIIQQDFIVRIIMRGLGLSSDYDLQPYPPEKAFNKLFEVLENKPEKPFFAWIHLNPPHFPYLPPSPFMGMFEPSDKYRTHKSQYDAVRSETPKSSGILRGRYDENIRYCDNRFEEFINKLEARGLLENTILILSSDHGESFERGSVSHGGPYLNEESVNIPLIIKEPGEHEGRVIHDLVEQIDIPATILGLSNISVPEWMEGRSLVPLMRGATLPSKPIFSMDLGSNLALGQMITKGSIAVWEGDYKLVHILDKPESVLYNLINDPDELNNLFEKEPEVGQRLLTLLQDNLKLANERIVSGK